MSQVSPLPRAIFDGDCGKIDALLAGSDPNQKLPGSDNWNLLHLALVTVTEPPKPEVVRHLIGLGVDVNARDRRQWTPLHFAARTKNAAVVKLLIEAGGDVHAKDNEGITPMHRYVLGDPVTLEVLELFLAAGAKTATVVKYVNAVVMPQKHEILDLLEKYEQT